MMHLKENEKKWLTIGYTMGAIEEMATDIFSGDAVIDIVHEIFKGLNLKFTKLEIRNLHDIANEYGMKMREEGTNASS